MSIDEILEEMDELLDKAGSVPFVSHKKVIDGERMRELINDVRLNMPHELKEAKKIDFVCANAAPAFIVKTNINAKKSLVFITNKL